MESYPIFNETNRENDVLRQDGAVDAPRFEESQIQVVETELETLEVDEHAGVRKIPSFDCRFNFSSIKGRKMHPSDLNVTAEGGWGVSARSHSVHREHKSVFWDEGRHVS